MRRKTMRQILTLGAALLSALAMASPAGAEFGLAETDIGFHTADGSPAVRAGSHPFSLTTKVVFNTVEDGKGHVTPEGSLRDLEVEMPPGFAGIPSATARCLAVDFAVQNEEFVPPIPSCPNSSAIGYISIAGAFNPYPVGGVEQSGAPLYNLVPPPGTVAKFGFTYLRVPVTIEVTLSEEAPYRVIAKVNNAPQPLLFYRSEVTVWGNPAAEVHDPLRGSCLAGIEKDGTPVSRGECPVGRQAPAFLTLPRSCNGPLEARFSVDSWAEPGVFTSAVAMTHDEEEPPNPIGLSECGSLAFNPGIGAEPTAKAASSPTGLDFSLDVDDPNITNPSEGAIGASDIEKAVVTLPEGMSANPSLAEGLEVCTMAQLDAESAFSTFGTGCPGASKIGTVEVETPLLPETLLKGSLFIAKPYENYADNSLLAMYLVIQNRELGISVKQVLRIEPDPVTGQLRTVGEELPQLPFSHFRLHFREGARSPLTTPQACGTYNAEATLYPWSGGPPVTSTSAFQIVTGPNEGPCPTGGLPPFKPGLIAGTINNRAGSFSPFNLRMFRSDAEQEITHFSIKLPPGITGKLAGIPYCSDAAIQAAKARTGPHGGQEELDSPSCPKASEIGRTLAGAGVGPALTYAPGKLYLAGPYNGSNLSMVAITAGKVGPFDIGTVVIRQAFKIDPETAEVFIDSTGSDPIPHIIRGIPVHLRDIRAYVDKPEFVLNPTDCAATSTASTVLGSGLDFVSEADDNPITVSSRFQAADCAALSFAPQLSMKLVGGTKRGRFPAFSAHLAMNGIGESGIQAAQVVLPKSEFIANAHFGSICTRVQFKEGAGNGAGCPANSIYGHAKAVTPILAEPLEGPVFLRSNGSERNLPDLVIALHNAQVDFDLVGFVDSVDGRLRNTFVSAPDAPVTSFDIELEGGAKGLFENSVNLCAKKHFAAVGFSGQNGKSYSAKPELKVKCPKKAKGKAKRHKRHHKRAAMHRMRAAG